MKFAAVLISLIFCSTSFAEPKAYVDMGWFKRNIVVDGKTLEQDFFAGFTQLPEAMKSNPSAKEFAERASNQWMWCNILSTATLVGLVYIVSTPSSRIDTGVLVAVLGSAFSTSFLQYSAMLNENRAINAYNGVKTADVELTPSFSILPVAGGGGGLLTWSF